MCSFNHEISELHIIHQKNIRITKFLKTMKTNQISSKEENEKSILESSLFKMYVKSCLMESSLYDRNYISVLILLEIFYIYEIFKDYEAM